MHSQTPDTAELFGRQVVDALGHKLGRVTALVHRADGCDVLVERRRWLRHTVVRLNLDDLVQGEQLSYRQRPARARQGRDDLARGGSGDDRVA